jgi:DNA-binding response OmpR family regulator
VGQIRHTAALVEIGGTSRAFRCALRKTFKGLPLPLAGSLDDGLRLARRVILLLGDGVDPVAPILHCAKGRRPHVLVACDRAEGSEVARWARAGVTHCFVGAGSLAELYAAVQSSAAGESFDVQLDVADLAIEVAGARTRLTRTQFRLLHHLTTNAGRWVTAPELVKEAIGTHHENDSALVRVHIHAIRRALGPLAPLIETDPARARGYRFRKDLVESPISARARSPRHPSS